MVVDEPILDSCSSKSRSGFSIGKRGNSVEIISAEGNEWLETLDLTGKNVPSLLVLSDIEILQVHKTFTSGNWVGFTRGFMAKELERKLKNKWNDDAREK